MDPPDYTPKPSKQHPLFRKLPPWNLVLDVCKLLRIPTDFAETPSSPVMFTKDDLNMENSEEAVATLYGYYKPCKAAQFLDRIDQVKWITVLKHCLLVHGYKISRHETTRSKKKIIQYTIEKMIEEAHQDIIISFV